MSLNRPYAILNGKQWKLVVNQGPPSDRGAEWHLDRPQGDTLHKYDYLRSEVKPIILQLRRIDVT